MLVDVAPMTIDVAFLHIVDSSLFGDARKRG
jgi:hypothetical protein